MILQLKLRFYFVVIQQKSSYFAIFWQKLLFDFVITKQIAVLFANHLIKTVILKFLKKAEIWHLVKKCHPCTQDIQQNLSNWKCSMNFGYIVQGKKNHTKESSKLNQDKLIKTIHSYHRISYIHLKNRKKHSYEKVFSTSANHTPIQSKKLMNMRTISMKLFDNPIQANKTCQHYGKFNPFKSA